MKPEDEDEEDAGLNMDPQRQGKCVVLKTSTRQTIFLPVVGLVDANTLKPSDLVGVNKDSYLILDTLPAEYDSRVKAMEVSNSCAQNPSLGASAGCAFAVPCIWGASRTAHHIIACRPAAGSHVAGRDGTCRSTHPAVAHNYQPITAACWHSATAACRHASCRARAHLTLRCPRPCSSPLRSQAALAHIACLAGGREADRELRGHRGPGQADPGVSGGCGAARHAR